MRPLARVLVVAVISVAVLTGCSHREAATSAAPTASNTTASDASVSPTDGLKESDRKALDSPCSLLSGSEIAEVFGVADLGPATKGDEYSDGGDGLVCAFLLPSGSGAAFGDSSMSPSVTLEFGTYAAEKGVVNGYSMADPATMLSTYFAAEMSQSKAKGIADLPVQTNAPGLGLVRDRNTVLWAVDDSIWAEVSLTSVAGGQRGYAELRELIDRLSRAIPAQ